MRGFTIYALYLILLGNKGRSNLSDLGVDGKIIFKYLYILEMRIY